MNELFMFIGYLWFYVLLIGIVTIFILLCEFIQMVIEHEKKTYFKYIEEKNNASKG